MESKDKTKIKLGLIGVAAAVILAGIVVGADQASSNSVCQKIFTI